eukprot:COSAG06_NODE_15188_length_1091_cov_1.720766_1_plen_62_part_01
MKATASMERMLGKERAYSRRPETKAETETETETKAAAAAAAAAEAVSDLSMPVLCCAPTLLA